MLLDGFNIKRGIAFGPVAAVAAPIAKVATAVGAVKSAFGSGGSSATPSYGESSANMQSGYVAMPKYLQDIYENQFTPAVMDYFNSPEGRNPNPIAGFNPTQQQALQQGGQNIQQIQAGLQDYMNPYNQFVTDQIRRNYGMEQNSLLGNAQKMGGVGALKSSSLGTQLSLNNEAMQRALAEAQYNSYRDALGLRRQTLADMFEAGLMEQQQEQRQMSAAAENPLSRVKNLGQLLALIPQGQVSSSSQFQRGALDAQDAAPNQFQRIGAGLGSVNRAFNSGDFNALYSSGKPIAGTYGAPRAGIFNKMFGM